MRNMPLVWKHSMLGVIRLKLKSFKHEGLLHSVLVVVVVVVVFVVVVFKRCKS